MTEEYVSDLKFICIISNPFPLAKTQSMARSNYKRVLDNVVPTCVATQFLTNSSITYKVKGTGTAQIFCLTVPCFCHTCVLIGDMRSKAAWEQDCLAAA